MESWEHCAKTWCLIDVGLALENIKRRSIVKCKLSNGEEYIYNITTNPEITTDQLYFGKWYVYTWAL